MIIFFDSSLLVDSFLTILSIVRKYYYYRSVQKTERVNHLALRENKEGEYNYTVYNLGLSMLVKEFRKIKKIETIIIVPAVIKVCYSHVMNINISVCLGNNGHLTTSDGMADIPHHNHLTVIHISTVTHQSEGG